MDALDGQAHPVHRQADPGIGAGGLRPQPDHVDPEDHRRHQQQGQEGARPGPHGALDRRFLGALIGGRLGAEDLGQVLGRQGGRRALEQVLVGGLGIRPKSAFLGVDPELKGGFGLGFPG